MEFAALNMDICRIDFFLEMIEYSKKRPVYEVDKYYDHSGMKTFL